jgi:N-acetylneuraminic acid mutarotase
VRVLIVLTFCAAASSSVFSLPVRAFLRSVEPGKLSQRTLTIEERVAYQRTIEEIYWRHRIWPKERKDPKPSLDAVMSQAQLEKKVTDYLRNSQALEDYWQRPITAEQLQAEMDRMAKNTKQPEVLRELFEALGNDPFLIAECLARPSLAERLLTNWYSYDQRIHGELKQRAEAELQSHPSIDAMKQLGGNYNEIEFVRTDNNKTEDRHGAGHTVKLEGREWDETVQRLTTIFNVAKSQSPNGKNGLPDPALASVRRVTPCQSLPVGKLSSLQEDGTSFYVTAIIQRTGDRLKLATVSWQKEAVESWRARAEDGIVMETAAPNASYAVPVLRSEGCIDDTWGATSMNMPLGRYLHTAIWTGSEMIIWGGENTAATFGTGGKYNPSTDTWTETSISNSPSPRSYHTAVWTGTEMIIWGGLGMNALNTGGRYNPSANSWTATTTNNAPTAREAHTAVWTGNEMIIWGGAFGDFEGYLNTGGRYNPSTDTWVATSIASAPTARYWHKAVWTDNEMIVWGGYDFFNDIFFNTGGRYNPNTNSWTAITTTNAPDGRSNHTAVWTGSEMIVWGGYGESHSQLNNGGRYNPSTNGWTATSTTNAPTTRHDHTAVWTGTEMIVWGGAAPQMNTGGRYNPITNSWTATSTTNAPPFRWLHTAIWTGNEMIVWGGNGNNDYSHSLTTGGRYNPTTNTWTTTNGNSPAGRTAHTAVWTGSELIVWGGYDVDFNTFNTGGEYNPITDSWTATSTASAPTGRANHTAIWTGTEMIIWGGFDGFGVNTGGKYNPATNAWTATSTVNAPLGRSFHTAVWTGAQMIVWGGYDADGNVFNTGGRYNPSTGNWTTTSTTNAPTARSRHTAIWTGNEMVVWGGTPDAPFNQNTLNTGGRYNPSTNTWEATTTTNAPSPRVNHTATWTGDEMIVWGGYFYDGTDHVLNTGGKYNPSMNTWTATSTTNAPEARSAHTAVWTGSDMIVWGGGTISAPYLLHTGGRYNPTTDSWTASSTANAPSARYLHTAVWADNEMIVWGGWSSFFGPLDGGGIYCAQSGPTPTPSPTPTPTPCTGRCDPTPRPRPTPHVRPTPAP